MSIAYQVGYNIAEKLKEWDLEPTTLECSKEAEKEGFNFDEQDWKDFYEGVKDASR